MLQSLNVKLWLILFATLFSSLGSLLLLTQQSVKQHFLKYATDQILERLAPLEQAIAHSYQRTASLSDFEDAPEKWIRLRDATYRQYLQDLRTQAHQLPVGQISPATASQQRVFFHHLTLHDLQKIRIAGQLLDSNSYIYKPIRFNGDIIAYIGYIKPKAFFNAEDQFFMNQQFRAFLIISGILFILSFVIAAMLSRWLVAPLGRLSKNAQRVAQGDLSVRTNIKRKDELGVLADNFNTMAASLEHTETLRQQWVADISHELRTPVSVLKAQVEALEDGIRPADTENLNILSKNIESLRALIDDLYDLSLADTKALPLTKESVTINAIIKDVCDSFEEKVQQKSLSLSIDSTRTEHSRIHVDPKRIRQLLFNLLENSTRYTHSPGRIHIHTQKKLGHIIVIIEDSAPGVKEHQLTRLFDRLYRTDYSRNRAEGGAGLGLSICQNIIASHQGTIQANHSPLGGLKITLTLNTEL